MSENNNALAPTMPADNARVTILDSNEALQAITAAETDILVNTAHKYPRDLGKVIDEVRTLAKGDQDTAASCFYSLNRGGKIIEGPSVRLSEIIRASYGNIQVGSRIIANDGRFITAQGVCIDYEKNNRASSEVKVRITDKSGRTYNDDMIVVASNAACAKAERNAVYKIVPMALFKSILDEVKDVAVGKATDLATTRAKMIDWYGKAGVNQEMLFQYLGIGKIEEITSDMVQHLRGLSTALKEGSTTIEESIISVIRDRNAESEAKENKSTASAAAARSAAKAAAKRAATVSAASPEGDMLGGLEPTLLDEIR